MNATAQYVFPTPFREVGALSYPEARCLRPALSHGPVEAADHSKQAFICDKGLLLPLRNSSGRYFSIVVPQGPYRDFLRFFFVPFF